jgi:bifunctional N-acetylglucosamine-1-phosphate-uridyltransferase/glucosamine-1-phosphate-acetyltransferase GlmU-like protein
MSNQSYFDEISAVILAAGNSRRMNSPLPKVLHTIRDKPMIEWVIEALTEAKIQDICLILKRENVELFDPILEKFQQLSVCIQEKVNGTAGAVASSAPIFYEKPEVPYGSFCRQKTGLKNKSIPKARYILVCFGDGPGVRAEDFQSLILNFFQNKAKIALVGALVPDSTGYGRLVLDEHGKLLKIIEENDATELEKSIRLINTGIFLAQVDVLFGLLKRVESKNKQQEYYLTDCIELAVKDGISVEVFINKNWQRFLGVNTQNQLTEIAKLMR